MRSMKPDSDVALSILTMESAGEATWGEDYRDNLVSSTSKQPRVTFEEKTRWVVLLCFIKETAKCVYANTSCHANHAGSVLIAKRLSLT